MCHAEGPNRGVNQSQRTEKNTSRLTIMLSQPNDAEALGEVRLAETVLVAIEIVGPITRMSVQGRKGVAAEAVARVMTAHSGGASIRFWGVLWGEGCLRQQEKDMSGPSSQSITFKVQENPCPRSLSLTKISMRQI